MRLRERIARVDRTTHNVQLSNVRALPLRQRAALAPYCVRNVRVECKYHRYGYEQYRERQIQYVVLPTLWAQLYPALHDLVDDACVREQEYGRGEHQCRAPSAQNQTAAIAFVARERERFHDGLPSVVAERNKQIRGREYEHVLQCVCVARANLCRQVLIMCALSDLCVRARAH